MDNLNKISNKLTTELGGLEDIFSETVIRIKILEEFVSQRISYIHKMLDTEHSNDWVNKLPQIVDTLMEVKKSVNQIKGINLPDELIVFENIDNVSNEDVLS